MSKRYLKVVALILVFSIPGCTLQGEPMFNGTVLEFSGNTLIATNDYLYVGAGTTRCVDWDGTIMWETEIHGSLKMVLAKDVLFLSTYEYSEKSSGVALLDLHGRILWQKELGDTPVKGLDASDDLLASSEEETLWAFSRNGNNTWEYTHSSPINEIAVAPDSSCVAFIDCYGFVNCVENGALVWSQSTRTPRSWCTVPDHLALAFAPDSSYIVYGSEKDTAVVVATPNGEEIWSHPVNECPLSVAITGDSQYIIVGCPERVYKFEYDGTLLWSVELPGDVDYIAVTPGGEYIAAGCDTNVDSPGLFVVFYSDGTVFWKTKTINIFRGVALSPDGTFAAFTIFKGYVHIFHNPPQVM